MLLIFGRIIANHSAIRDVNVAIDDGTPDSAPTTAALPNGQLLVGWQNTSYVLPDTATLPDELAAQEIAVATFDPAAGTVTTTTLTNNEPALRIGSPELR